MYPGNDRFRRCSFTFRKCRKYGRDVGTMPVRPHRDGKHRLCRHSETGHIGREVYRITTDLLSKTSQYKNFVISSGCDMPPLVPDANIKAFYQAIADFNTGK